MPKSKSDWMHESLDVEKNGYVARDQLLYVANSEGLDTGLDLASA